MIRFKDIHIPKPCSVDYDALPGDEVKRFCGSCEKHVYDFRGKDEAYLNKVFQRTGKLCGIYDKDKINSSYSYKPSLFQSVLSKVFALSLFFRTLTVQADSNTKEILTPISQTTFETDTIPAIKATIKNKKQSKLQYRISIYIDGIPYKLSALITEGYLYLPDSITDDQKIKIIVHQRVSFRNHIRIIQKKYAFRFDHSDKINVRVHYDKYVFLIRKRGNRRVSQTQIMGLLK